VSYIKDITDGQILRILDLTTWPPAKPEEITKHPNRDYLKQREGMDTLLGTDEGLIASIREILNPKIETLCECHERDSSYTCSYCQSQGYFGHMQQSLQDQWDADHQNE